MLFAVLALFVGAALTPMPAALREGAAYGSSVRFVDRDGEILREVRAEGDHTRAQWSSLGETGKNGQPRIIPAGGRPVRGAPPRAWARAGTLPRAS